MIKLFFLTILIIFSVQQDDVPRFPNDFLWGVATSSYQIEVNLN